MSERTTINWHQGLRLGDLKRRYRRFWDSHQINSHGLTPESYELEEQWDYDEYWDPWDPGPGWSRERWLDYLTYKLENLDTLVGLNRLDMVDALGQAVDIVLPLTETAPKTPVVQPYLPKELPPLLSTHVRMMNEGDVASVHETLRNAFKGVSLTDVHILAEIQAELRTFSRNTRKDYVCSLPMILLLAPFWVRPLSGWTGNHLAGRKLILSLVDYLFVTYPVPKFLYGNWLTERDLPTAKWIYWFVLLGQGANLHQATEHFADWAIPKSFVRYLYQAPPYLTPLESCMWAEVHRLGGSSTEFDRLRWHPAYAWDPTSKHERDPRFQTFWHDTVRWLVRYRGQLTDQTCFLILDWASHMFGMDQRGQFTLRNRSPRRACEAAQRFNETRKNPLAATWRSHGWHWEYVDQDEDVWAIRELTSGYQLVEEGRAMNHCVQSYAGRCSTGLDSIFSLTVDGERRLTIQVNPANKRIAQALGFRNRMATPQENLVLGVWQKEVLDS